MAWLIFCAGSEAYKFGKEQYLKYKARKSQKKLEIQESISETKVLEIQQESRGPKVSFPAPKDDDDLSTTAETMSITSESCGSEASTPNKSLALSR